MSQTESSRNYWRFNLFSTLTLLAAGASGPPGGLRGCFFRPRGPSAPQKTVKKPITYLEMNFYVESFISESQRHFPGGIWTKNAGQSWKSWVLLYFKKIVFGDDRVQGPKKILQGLGIFPGVPYHIWKMMAKVSCVWDHWEESQIFWPGALFWGPLRPWAFF